jgi:hypothetical protein
MPPPRTLLRTSTPHLTSPRSAWASSSRTNLASSQSGSSLGTSARASPPSHSSGCGGGHGRRGCCRSDDNVDGSTHIVTTNSDRAGRETPVSILYYTLDESGGIMTDGLGQGARRYLLELVRVHVRSVYDPSTYRDGVIE